MSIRESNILGNRSKAYFGVMPPEYDFSFAFVRNPYERVVSAWRMFYEGRSFLRKIRLTFPEFVDIVTNEDIGYKGSKRPAKVNIRHHCLPITHEFNCIDYAKYIGRFESIHKDWSYIKNKLGVNENLPHKNKSKPYSWRNAYTKKEIIKLTEFYEKDLERFNYKKL